MNYDVLFTFFDALATLFVLYFKILAPLAAVYLMSYQLLSFVYSQLPSVRVNSSLNIEFRYLKGDKRDTVRKRIAISALTGIFFYLMVLVLPREYRNDDLTFYRDITLSLLTLTLMYFLYQINKIYYPEPLFRLIRKFFDKRLSSKDLYEKELNPHLPNKVKINSPLQLLRNQFSKKDLEDIITKFDFTIDSTSINRLLYLVNNGILFDDKEKVIIKVGAYKEGKVEKTDILNYLNEMFDLGYFKETHRARLVDGLKRAHFVKFLNNTIVITKSDEST